MNILYRPHQYSQQRQNEKKRWIWPVHLAMEATYYRDQGYNVAWDEDCDGSAFDHVITDLDNLPFERLPAPDRILTKANNPKYQNNGNYKHHPGTYIQSAAGCWWGRCAFCKEKGNPYVLRSVASVIEEIKECKRLGYKEVFDDAASFMGAFYNGEWIDEFCRKLEPLNMVFSCNLRFGSIGWGEYRSMKKAGFRMLLYGLESANRETLDRINKGVYIKEAIKELRYVSELGLEPHICVIFGYPWETDEDAIRTLKLVHWLLRKGIAKTAQASLYTIPEQPPRIIECQKYVSKIYHAAFYPDFWINKLKDVRTMDDIKYIWRGITSCFGI